MDPYITDEYLEEAYRQSFENGAAIQKRVQQCGCFHCGQIYSSEELDDTCFMTERSGKTTAFCPYCGVDAVLCEDSGFPITREFVAAMCRKYFS